MSGTTNLGDLQLVLCRCWGSLCAGVMFLRIFTRLERPVGSRALGGPGSGLDRHCLSTAADRGSRGPPLGAGPLSTTARNKPRHTGVGR